MHICMYVYVCICVFIYITIIENTPSHQAHTKRPYNIRRTIKNLPWTKWKKQREIVKPKVK